MVEAARTVRIPLIVPADRRDDLHQTRPKYQHCQDKTVEYCWPDTPTQPDDLITDKGDAEAALGGVGVPQRLERVAPLVPQFSVLSSMLGHRRTTRLR